VGGDRTVARLGGKPRVNDRRVISGVLHIPAEYGPRTTLFNRFNRWSEKGIWQALLAALAACDDPPEIAMVDSTAVRAHRSAAGAKGGSRAKQLAARAAVRRPRSTRSQEAASPDARSRSAAKAAPAIRSHDGRRPRRADLS